MAYQLMFAVITPALISGAFTDRVKPKTYLLFLVLWQLLVYYPFAHMVWGGGWLAKWGVLDFTGGIVVHATAGAAALASVIYVGRRRDTKSGPNSIPLVAVGTGLLWFGEGLKKIASVDIRRLFDKKGALLPPHLWPDGIAEAVESFVVVEIGGAATTAGGVRTYTKRVKLQNGLRAIFKLVDLCIAAKGKPQIAVNANAGVDKDKLNEERVEQLYRPYFTAESSAKSHPSSTETPSTGTSADDPQQPASEENVPPVSTDKPTPEPVVEQRTQGKWAPDEFEGLEPDVFVDGA